MLLDSSVLHHSLCRHKLTRDHSLTSTVTVCKTPGPKRRRNQKTFLAMPSLVPVRIGAIGFTQCTLHFQSILDEPLSASETPPARILLVHVSQITSMLNHSSTFDQHSQMLRFDLAMTTAFCRLHEPNSTTMSEKPSVGYGHTAVMARQESF